MTTAQLGRARWLEGLKRGSADVLVVRIAGSNSAEGMDIRLLLGAIAKLRKATISSGMSPGLSARNNSAPTTSVFIKFDISHFFENLFRKFKCN